LGSNSNGNTQRKRDTRLSTYDDPLKLKRTPRTIEVDFNNFHCKIARTTQQ